MLLNLSQVPFSAFGSYMAISETAGSKAEKGLYLKSVRGGDEDPGLAFRLELTRQGEPVPYRYTATASQLDVIADDGCVQFCFQEPDVIRITGHRAGLRLVAVNETYDYAVAVPEGVEVNSYSKETRFGLYPLSGVLRTDAPWEKSRCTAIAFEMAPGEGEDGFELLLHEYRVQPRADVRGLLSGGPKRTEEHFTAYLDRTLQSPSRYEEARKLAAYITWSCVVSQEGYLPRRAMYMSKNWMTNIWSWDHCFNAMALVRSDPDLAWDQFMIFFDRQHESGMLPDLMNDKYALWNGCKPPIHGWTLAWMMDRTDRIGTERLREVYEPLAKWTNFWFRHRDDDRDGIPQYNHGNDSGWDNGTAFHLGVPVETPDLSAFLVLQMEVLGNIASRLGLEREASEWDSRAKALLHGMIDHFWDGEAFRAKLSGKHTPSVGDSLQLFLPIVLGRRLPEPVMRKLVEGLKEQGRFLTGHGFATESVRSEFYEADGYWRGPIWAPSTMLVYEGLKACGEHEFALDIAARFCGMAAKSGMAENFDAVSGEGLRDRAFTWTSSVFLMLANELYQTKGDTKR
ncbi:hypothetical protein SD70_01445 [Gordoniibacillus kamchatkensis]|uniref:Mannosylglycerate hydrolase MGH1-like glycoside hydrolase domain-containing protein n=1 Tax=Gordoniibacillus kamchatkensis TaxID=1590651 RepID=A0ABR5AMH8_9BACL|nr:trehalase family glycosidase [Paenibacillus sp. VKM B-2647]KIL42239.1 hypothetical protein SD70_01445 [Paenibacillus sp. VKM B-2647]